MYDILTHECFKIPMVKYFQNNFNMTVRLNRKAVQSDYNSVF